MHVLESFLEIIPDLRKYAYSVMEKKLSNPHTKSSVTVRSGCQDFLAEQSSEVDLGGGGGGGGRGSPDPPFL